MEFKWDSLKHVRQSCRLVQTWPSTRLPSQRVCISQSTLLLRKSLTFITYVLPNWFPMVGGAWLACYCSGYRATIPSLNEFRNLFNLFNNPKPDSGWWSFKAKPHLSIHGEYPSNFKGWKNKFLFALGDDWEFALGESQEFGVPRSWSIPSQPIVLLLYSYLVHNPLLCCCSNVGFIFSS